MSPALTSFDDIVAEVTRNRPRSEFLWYGKTEIMADGKPKVRVLLLSPGLLLEFDRDLNREDLILCNQREDVIIEKEENGTLVRLGGFPTPLDRFASLDPRLVETFLIPEFRKRLLDALIQGDPVATRWAVVHGLPVWRKIKMAGKLDWESAILPYIPFEYENKGSET
jgi:hypothetical protein